MQTKNWSITEAPIDEEFVTSISKPEHTLAFRVLDDDGVVYFKGRMRPTKTEALFAPLDSFAGWGCTSIQILENGIWQTV